MKEEPGCDLCGDQGPLLLAARCHLTAPLQATRRPDPALLPARVQARGGAVPGRPRQGVFYAARSSSSADALTASS